MSLKQIHGKEYLRKYHFTRKRKVREHTQTINTFHYLHESSTDTERKTASDF